MERGLGNALAAENRGGWSLRDTVRGGFFRVKRPRHEGMDSLFPEPFADVFKSPVSENTSKKLPSWRY